MELWETGLLNKFVSDTFNIPNAEECFSTKKSTARDEPIKLVDSTDAFLILHVIFSAFSKNIKYLYSVFKKNYASTF